jgi:RHS repeat-associated protein
MKKTVTQGSTTNTTEYLNEFQYLNGTLQFIQHAEGYVKYTAGGSSGFYNYVYYLKDHLGNIRVLFTKQLTNNTAKLLKENHYYPFGLKHPYNSFEFDYYYYTPTSSLTIGPTTNSNRYQYNSKEWQNELSLNLYDYGARMFDPAIGRWGVVDPLSEKYGAWSPYNYVYNNPLKFVDPTGMGPDDYFEAESGNIVWRNSKAKKLVENGKVLKNIGESYASFNGSYLTYYYQTVNKDGNFSPSYISLPAVSGRPDDNGMFDYSIERQMRSDVGPIPEGRYQINLSEAPDMDTWENLEGLMGAASAKLGFPKFGTFPGGRYAWGDGRIDINPDKVKVPNTGNPFDLFTLRGGFTIHGGSEPGSAGCIDLCNGFSLFKSMVTKYSSVSKNVLLNVKYYSVKPVKSPF